MMKKYLLQLHTPRIRTGGGRISYLLTLLLLFAFVSTAGAYNTTTFKNNFTNNQVLIFTGASAPVDYGEWLGYPSGTKQIKWTIDDSGEFYQQSSSAHSPYVKDTDAQTLKMNVQGVSKMYIYYRNNGKSERTLKATVNGGSEITLAANVSPESNGVAELSLTAGNQNIVHVNGSNEIVVFGIRVETSSSSVVTPSLSATNLSLTVGSTGKSTITATANGSAVNNLNYSYLSSNTGVATVASDGTVTARAVGTATITVTSAAVANTYNAASTTFTVTVREASTPSGESTRWDFTTTTEEEALSLVGTKFEGKNQFVQSRSGQFARYEWYSVTGDSGNEPNVLSGLQFACDAGGWGNAFRIFYAGDRKLYFVNSNFKVKIPALVAGDKVKVTWCSGLDNTNAVTISGDNMHTSGTTTSNDRTTPITTEFVVNNDGDAIFSFSKNAYLYKIEVEGDERIALNTFRPMGGQSGLATVNYNEFGNNSSLDISHYAILAYANANDDPHVAFQNSDFEVISSSDESVVPLSGISLDGYGTNGRLMVNYRVLKKEGESTITVRFKGNTTYKPAVCEFTVTVIDTRKKISISSVDYTMWRNSTYQPPVAIIDETGAQVSGLALTYTSSNSNVTINSTSPLTLGSGNSNNGSTIKISFTGDNQYRPASGEFKISVVQQMPVTVDAAKMYLVNNGTDTKQVSDYVSLKDANGNVIDNNTGYFSITWADASADHLGVTYDDGLNVTAGTQKGKTKIAMTFHSNNTLYANANGSMIVEVVGVEAPVIVYDENNKKVTITQPRNMQVTYTIDGSDPRISSTANTASPPVDLSINGTCTIYAVTIAGSEKSTVTEKNILFPGTYQYTMADDNAEAPAIGKVIESKDGDNVVLRMTYGALPEFKLKNDKNSIWQSRSRDGDVRDAEFEGYNYTTVALDYDGTSEDGYDGSKGYGEQFCDLETNTPFSLPIAGAYVKFEPECDGKLQVVIRQNGTYTLKKTNGVYEPDKTMRKRVVYVADETGRALEPGVDYSAQMNLNSVIDDQLFTFYNNDNSFGNNSYDRDNNFPYYKELLGLPRNATYDQWTALANQVIPNIMVNSLANGEKGNRMGYLVVSKAYVKYTINVKAGKTYFLTGNLTKVGFCGYQFTPDATYAERKNTAAELREGESGGSAVNTTLLNNGNVNKPMDVKVYRKFEADTWATLVLPFSVSASKVREVFGDGTLILNFADVTNETNENGKPIINLHLRKHYHQMIVAGMPLLIRPAQTVENATFSNVTLETLNVEPMSQNIHASDNNYRPGYTLNGSYEPTVMPAYAYYLVDDEFRQKTTGKTTNSKGMRAWIDGASGPFQAKVNYVNLFTDFADDDIGIATEVEQIAEALGLQMVPSAAIYNLHGQMVSTDGNREGLPAGVYVQNGKKFVIR